MSTVTTSIGMGLTYTTITAWEYGLDDSTVYDADDDAVGVCHDAEYDESVTIDGGDLDDDSGDLLTVTLTVLESARHDGTASVGTTIMCNDTSANVFNLQPLHTGAGSLIVEWLIFDNNSDTGANIPIDTGSATNNHVAIFRNNIMTGVKKRFINATTRDIRCQNSIFYGLTSTDGSTSAFFVNGQDAGAGFINNTMHDLKSTGVGMAPKLYGINMIYNHANGNMHNNLITDVEGTAGNITESAFYSGNTPFNIVSRYSNNASEDTSSVAVMLDGTVGSSECLTGVDPANLYVSVADGSEDLRLKAGADVIGEGADEGTTTGANIDIVGRNRDARGDTWDIGAHQYVASVPSAGGIDGVVRSPARLVTHKPSFLVTGQTSQGGATSITITSPNGSEDWDTGSTHDITWSSNDVVGNVKIELYKGGSLNSTLTSDTANDGSYSWAISAGLADGADYRIRITSIAEESVYDESDANFELAAPPSLTVTAPNGSESWALDSTQSITWSSVNLTGNVKIELYKGGSLESTLTSDTANDGSYSWAISDSLTAAADYKIRITSLADGTVYDESDANFTLSSAASITVDVPNGGEDWIAGVEQTVEWSSTGITGNVNIKLYDDGSITNVVVWSTANDGSFSFTPDVYRISDTMQIRIESSDDNSIYDYSDADFTIALDYSPPSVSSGLVVKLDVADPDSYTNGSTKWVNTVDDTEGDLVNGPDLDGTDYIASIEFDGTDDYFNLDRDNSDLDDGWSLVVWLNPQELTSSGVNGWFINLAQTYPYLQMGILHFPGGGLFGTRGYDSAVGWVSWYDEPFTVDEWHQFVLVNQNDGTYDVFLNNVKDASPPTGFSTDTAPGDDILAGAYSNYGTASSHLETRIAQILMYDRALSDSEVEDLWDGDKERFGLS